MLYDSCRCCISGMHQLDCLADEPMVRLLIHRRVEIRDEVGVVFRFDELVGVLLFLLCCVVVVIERLECLRVDFLNLFCDVAWEELIELYLVIAWCGVEVIALIIIVLVVVEVVICIVVVAGRVVVAIVVIIIIAILIVIVLIIVSVVVEVGLLDGCVIEIAVLVIIVEV